MNRWKNPRGPGPIPWMENYLSICIHVNRRANEINGRPRLGETGDKMRDNIKSHQTAAGKCIFDESAMMIAGERIFGELTSFRRWLIKSDDFNIFDFRSDSRESFLSADFFFFFLRGKFYIISLRRREITSNRSISRIS